MNKDYLCFINSQAAVPFEGLGRGKPHEQKEVPRLEQTSQKMIRDIYKKRQKRLRLDCGEVKEGNLAVKRRQGAAGRSNKGFDRMYYPRARITSVDEGGRNVDRSRRRSCTVPIHSCRSQGTGGGSILEVEVWSAIGRKRPGRAEIVEARNMA